MNQWASWYFFVIYLLLIFSKSISQEKQITSCVTVFHNNSIYHDEIEKLITQPVLIKNVTFESDIYFQKEEFFYITDIVPGIMLDSFHLIRAVEYLSKKNKFSTIKIQVVFSENGLQLHFLLNSFWTFKKIKMHGVFQGKNIFTQCYLMNRGDIFNSSKHNYSIVKIKELLENDGYFSNKVTSSFEYDKKTKEVIVHIYISKGKRFKCSSISVEIINDNDNEYNDLQTYIIYKLSNNLSFQKYKKELINYEAISLKTYLSRKGFLQTGLAIEEYKNKHNYTVDLKWKITVQEERSFLFLGNQFFSKKELLEKIVTFGRSAWLMPASLLAEEIFNAYKKKGFWKAKVIGQEEKKRSVFIIQEGDRAIIKDVEIHNVQLIDSSFIKKHCFRKMLRNKYYDAHLYDEAIKLLANVYLNEGFLSFNVIDYNFVPLENDNEYKLNIIIDEGKQSYIASVTIEGYEELEKEEPFKKNFINNKTLFDNKIIDQQRTWLVHYFQKIGYLHPRIKSQITMKDYEIFIVWIVDPGEKVYFGKTIITGSFTFPFKNFMTLIDYKQTEMWNQEKVKQTFKLLKDLDIFESINLSPDYTDQNQEKPVILKMYLDDFYEIRVRAGLELQHVKKYQTFNGLTYKIGGTGLIKNPFNSGDIARLDLDFARSHREIIAHYKRPIFSKPPLICNAQIYSISYDQPGFIGSVNDIYTLVQNGFSCGVERKNSFFEYGFIVGCEGMITKIKNPLLQKSLIKAIDFQPQLVDKTIVFFFIEPTIMIEYLDNALNPTSGFLTLCTLKGMIPFQKQYKKTLFFKLLCEQSFFIPLKTVVAAFRLRFGHIFYRKLSAIMPSERFYLGGSHSLRGYEADLAPPLGVFVDEDCQEQIVPRGGKSMCNINSELRFPIIKKMGGVIFQDFGILSGDTFDDFKPQNFLAATGFGLRFYTPLGPLRFDIGWKWRKQISLERSYAWFLTFGQAF